MRAPRRWGPALAPRAGSSAHLQPGGEDGTGSERGWACLRPRQSLVPFLPRGSRPSHAAGQRTLRPCSRPLLCSVLGASPAHLPLAQGLISAGRDVPEDAGLLPEAACGTHNLHLPPAGLSCCSLIQIFSASHDCCVVVTLDYKLFRTQALHAPGVPSKTSGWYGKHHIRCLQHVRLWKIPSA